MPLNKLSVPPLLCSLFIFISTVAINKMVRKCPVLKSVITRVSDQVSHFSHSVSESVSHSDRQADSVSVRQ